jgi:hypothetical protein
MDEMEESVACGHPKERPPSTMSYNSPRFR